jgi:hypothetical protein
MEEATGPMMPRIGRVYLIQTPPRQSVMEAVCARTCNRADRPDNRSIEAPTRNPAATGWAIVRFPSTHPAGTVALLAAFGKAAPRGRRATMGIRASDPPGVVGALRAGRQRRAGVVETHHAGRQRRAGAAEAPRAGRRRRAGVVAAQAAAVVVASVARSERKSWRIPT